MPVSNLTRYEPCRTIEGWKDFPSCRPCSKGEYVKFKEAVKASSDSIQHVRNEIASLAGSIEYAVESKSDVDINFIVFKLRQLSKESFYG